MTKFKIGDRVKYICKKSHAQNKDRYGQFGVIRNVDSNSILVYWDDGSVGSNYNKSYIFEDSFELVENESSNKNQMDKETLKTFSKDNLAEGKRKAEEDHASYEATESKNAYKKLVDRKDEQERVIKVAKEELKAIGDVLKVFD